MIYFKYALLTFNSLSFAQHVYHSTLSSLESSQVLLKDDDGIDIITGSDFNGLTTFANLPYAKCFSDSKIEAYDIAILGAPFDTVSCAVSSAL